MSPRILIAEPNDDVRALLELTVTRLGYTAVTAEQQLLHRDVDAIILEPGYAAGRSVLGRFGDESPPVICLSIYPREQGLAPSSSVAYLLKPSSTQAISDALRAVFAD
jgi:DNA-binding response OmpR family regulator